MDLWSGPVPLVDGATFAAVAAASAASAALILAIRGLPFLAHVLTGAGYPLRARAAAVGIFAVVVACLSLASRRELTFFACGVGYYACVALAVHGLLRAQVEAVPRPALFALCFFLFLALPSLALTDARYRPFLSFGWERMLAAYSYCTYLGVGATSWKQGLFFLLVDPAIVYQERARRADGRAWRPAASRVAIGAVVIGASVAGELLRARWGVGRGGPLPWRVVAYSFWYFAVLYGSHVGLGHVQIGYAGLIGYSVPERYVAPWAAADPADFWRRWNTYVGGWFRKYVFFPVAAWVAERYPVPAVAKAAAVLVTFGAAGLLHDVYVFVDAGVVRWTGTLGFLCAGALVVVWAVAKQAVVGVAAARLPPSTRRRGDGQGWSRVCWWGFVAVILWALRGS